MIKAIARIVAVSLVMMLGFNFVIADEPIFDSDKATPFPYPAGPVKITNGYQGGPTHQHHSKYALDMQAPFPGSKSSCDQYGVPIIASRDGEVVKAKNAGEDGSFGTHVIIKSAKNIHIWYAHMVEHSIQVNTGDKVIQGQLLGLMGDTGNTGGVNCFRDDLVDGNGEKFSKTLIGVHLHTEMRKGLYGGVDEEGNPLPIALKYTALLGAEEYTDISVKDYTSTSLLTKDEAGYWNKMKDYFLYNLPEDAVGDVVVNDKYLPKIFNISPNIVRVNEKTEFTILGERLPQNLELDLGTLCLGGMEWIERERDIQRFSCTPIQAGFFKPTITLPGQKTLDGESIKMQFELKVLSEDETIQKSTIQGYPVLPRRAEPGEKIKLTIKGENLDSNLIIKADFCSSSRKIYQGLTHQTIECTIAPHIYNEDGELRNELLTHDVQVLNAEGEIVADSDLVVDHRLQIESISPSTAHFGQKTSFTIKGKGVHNLKAFHLDECRDLVVLSQPDLKDQVVIQCTLPMPEEFFSPLMPSSLKRKTLNLHVKEKRGGQMLLAGKIEAIAAPETWISKVIPYYPALDEEGRFTIQGKDLPDKLLYWMGHCGDGVLEPTQNTTAQFNCTPGWIGGQVAKAKLQQVAQSAKENPEAFVREVEKQRRLLEIKYPHELSGDGTQAITLYRTYILPLPKDYISLYLDALDGVVTEKVPAAFRLNENDNEEIIRYILKNKDNYSNTFLKKLGWKKDSGVYQITTCARGFYGPYQNQTGILGLSGACALNLESKLTGDDVNRLYPK